MASRPSGEQPSQGEAHLDLADPPGPKPSDLAKPALFQKGHHLADGPRWLAGCSECPAEWDERLGRDERG